MKSKIEFMSRFIVAVILLQSLYFKFTAHPEAVHIFSTLEVEPWGRILLGCVELIVGLTLVLPKTKQLATIAALGLMTGAVGTHLFTAVGIVVKWGNNSDGGQLFAMGIAAFVLSLLSLFLQRK